ncbi:MAG: 16S rRNA (cytidine(1402)-2'-O)-methyltransferase [Luteitalea sp.]|nr:16S rRNA (cytidine(1402)-2'-O)-methyltransferase [Luteitalea sp.]
MGGRLYVVSTPIGNLEDVTLRALRVLRDVALIAAEDTRRTRRLLAHASIGTRMISLHGHNERAASARVLGELSAARDVALVSDAGTPLLSDPGLELVRQALDAGIRVEPIPGPSAVVAALVVSGMPSHQFTFLGFPPARGKERRAWLQTLAQEQRTVVCFEAPHRIRRTLQDIAALVGDCQVAVCRELTKIHEELIRGPVSTVLAAESLQHPLGELTLVFDLSSGIAAPAEGCSPVTDQEIASLFGQMIDNVGPSDRRPRRRAIAGVATRYGISQKEVYAAIERAKRCMPSNHD